MNRQRPLLTDILKSVSRSFYLTLRVLPPKMRPAIGLGYLLCRTADSIADTDIVPAPERLNLLNQFSLLMDRFPLNKDERDKFSKILQASLTASSTVEGQLLSRFTDSISYLVSLTHTEQVLIQEIVRAVIQGMTMELRKFGETSESLKALESQQELETYIGWIGGEPGRFWTKVCMEHERKLMVENPSRWMEDGIRFGTGLQMVNVLRDIAADLKRGRCYIPRERLKEQNLEPQNLLEKDSHIQFLPLYHRLIDETIDRLTSGVDYLLQIPVSNFRLRAAVWWPLALGMKTLSLLRKNYFILDPNRTSKISHATVWGVISFSSVVLLSNKALTYSFGRMKDQTS